MSEYPGRKIWPLKVNLGKFNWFLVNQPIFTKESEKLQANGYPSIVISNILNRKPPSPTVPPPDELVSMFFKWAEPSDTYKGFACLPYISGLTEPITRLLRYNEIRVVNKPFKTHQQEFPSPKFRQPSDLAPLFVYIPFALLHFFIR